ncbi:MAG TPA: TolC family outer membrane protein [Pseudolabrys sp.]|nr:TolC family outer membrane protein [Pseudolabrys sp.]
MHRFLLATVSMVALTGAAYADDPPNVGQPLVLAPGADWSGNSVRIADGSEQKSAAVSGAAAQAKPARQRNHAAFLINEAISQAVLTNPGVGEAAANRRATETELYQVQGSYLPQVRLESRFGPEKFRQVVRPEPRGNDTWRAGQDVSVTVRQIIFNGFASIHEVWRQTARVNSAAFRVRERSELIALDAAEAYIDVVRFLRIVALANENVANHEAIYENVKSRFSGGRTGEGDLQQALERVEAAKAAQAEFRRGLDDARSKYRKIVGLEPINLRFPAPLPGLPRTKDIALKTALDYNPTLLAADSDREAAKQAFHATDGAFVPTVSLEGRASRGVDSDTFIGRRDEVSGKIVISWDIFRGGQDLWQRAEMAERYTEETMRHARLQRDALEAIDRAWAARTLTASRVAALQRQLAAEKKTIAIYRSEYEIGRRSLIDLLNAENQYFDAAVSLTSARGVIVFADYQLLAAMGALLDYLKTAKPVDAAPLDSIALVPAKLPPFILHLPQLGSEPLEVDAPAIVPEQQTMNFDQRWSASFSSLQAAKSPVGLGVPALSSGATLAFAPAAGNGLQNDLSDMFEPRAVLLQR